MTVTTFPAVTSAPPGSAVTDAFARLAEAYGGLRVIERTADEPLPAVRDGSARTSSRPAGRPWTPTSPGTTPRS